MPSRMGNQQRVLWLSFPLVFTVTLTLLFLLAAHVFSQRMFIAAELVLLTTIFASVAFLQRRGAHMILNLSASLTRAFRSKR